MWLHRVALLTPSRGRGRGGPAVVGAAPRCGAGGAGRRAAGTFAGDYQRLAEEIVGLLKSAESTVPA